MTSRPATPDDIRKAVAYAREHLACEDCGTAPGYPCSDPGPGRTVCKGRYRAAMITLGREARAARRTPAEAAELERQLAALARVPAEEIEACRTPGGGYSFTRERLASWGVPWPPPPGWRRAIERGPAGTGGL
jgi:hypothetical protein